jgi:hypothetical protein
MVGLLLHWLCYVCAEETQRTPNLDLVRKVHWSLGWHEQKPCALFMEARCSTCHNDVVVTCTADHVLVVVKQQPMFRTSQYIHTVQRRLAGAAHTGMTLFLVVKAVSIIMIIITTRFQSED